MRWGLDEQEGSTWGGEREVGDEVSSLPVDPESPPPSLATVLAAFALPEDGVAGPQVPGGLLLPAWASPTGAALGQISDHRPHPRTPSLSSTGAAPRLPPPAFPGPPIGAKLGNPLPQPQAGKGLG